jgi:hypothetical protein
VREVGKSYKKGPKFGFDNSDNFKNPNKKLRNITRNILKSYDEDIDDDLIIPDIEEVFGKSDKHRIYNEQVKKNPDSWNRGPDKRNMI